jgi:hypothetical protein
MMSLLREKSRAGGGGSIVSRLSRPAQTLQGTFPRKRSPCPFIR